jgi:2'-5' RNA ligase
MTSPNASESVELAEADLPDSCYAYVPSGGPPSARKLRLCSTATGKLDAGIIGAAAAALGPGFRGNRVQLPSGAVAGAKAKVRAAWKKVHPDSSTDDMPSGIQLLDVTMFTDFVLDFAEGENTGFLVALWLSSSDAEKIVLSSGESADSLHITLAYCGDAVEIGEIEQARAITAIDEFARQYPRLEGSIGGYGRFSRSESSDGQDVFYATPDIPRLAEFRQGIVSSLAYAGIPVSMTHGFIPHITLAYLSSDDKNPINLPTGTSLTFDGVTIVSAQRRIDVPFQEPMSEVPISMASSGDLPPEAFLGSMPARALYFGSFTKEWIPFLPKPGKYVHDIYGDLDFTPDTYDQILANFDANVYKQDLPIRATHTPDSGAIGWIRPNGMRLASDGSLEVKPEWNDLGRGLIEDDRFRYVSAEFCKSWTNPVTQEKTSNVAVGLALVTRPHFKTDVLNPLSVSEAHAFAEEETSSSQHSDFDIQERTSVMTDPQKPEDQNPTPPQTPPAPPAPPQDPKPPEPSEPKPPETSEPKPPEAVTLSDLTQVVLTAEQRQRERTAFADLTTRVDLAERRAVNAEAKLSEIEKSRRVEKFTSEVIGRSAENGHAWFGNPQDNVNHLVSLAETYGDDSSEVRWAVTQKRNEAQAIRATGLFDPISLGAHEDGASVTAQVTRLAEQLRSSNSNLTMEQAITKAYEENPELYIRSLRK